MFQPLSKLLAGLLLTATVTNANAALESRLNGQAVYDTDLNVTWLANANLAASNTFGVGGINANGSMSWNTAQSWISAMNAAGYLGYSDWRLPVTGPVNGVAYSYNWSLNGSTDTGENISAPGTVYASSKGSEMAYLFSNDLGNKAYCSAAGVCGQAGWGLTNTGPFSSLQSNIYWSGTEYVPDSSMAWQFGFNNGVQEASIRSYNFYALVVRTGDVAAVPEPETWGMMLAGLALIGAVTKQRLRQSLSI